MTASGSDFLANIAARVLGGAPLIEPRLPARFETAPVGADNLPRLWKEPLDEGAIPAVPEPARGAMAAETREVPEPLGREPENAAPPPEPLPPPKSENADRAVAVAGTPVPARSSPARVIQLAKESVDARKQKVARHGPQPLLVAPLGREAREEPERATRRPELPAALSPLPEEVRVSRAVADSDAPTFPTLHTVDAAPMPSRRAQAFAIDAATGMSEIRPRPTRREVRATAAAPAAKPSVVNISIGRVEVRAHAAEAAPRARPERPSRQAPQSLADYLEQRRGPR